MGHKCVLHGTAEFKITLCDNQKTQELQMDYLMFIRANVTLNL